MMPQGYAEHLAHLARLGRLPAWRAYVWDQAQKIDKMPGWAGFADALVAAIKSDRSASGRSDMREACRAAGCGTQAARVVGAGDAAEAG